MIGEQNTGLTARLALWARWRWHQFRWRDRDATWHSIHSYGCDSCEAHDG